jgi:predicted nucleic acid-binding protein
MKPRVYIETSVISYLTARESSNIQVRAHQIMTQRLWDSMPAFEFYISDLVRQEAGAGDAQAAAARLAVIEPLGELEITPEVLNLGQLLVDQLAIPAKAKVDAFHVAAATIHGMDYLVTWNCTHIANLQMRRKIEQICTQAGYAPALIGTPEELIAEQGEA